MGETERHVARNPGTKVCKGSCGESAGRNTEFSVVADIPNVSWAAYSAQ